MAFLPILRERVLVSQSHTGYLMPLCQRRECQHKRNKTWQEISRQKPDMGCKASIFLEFFPSFDSYFRFIVRKRSRERSTRQPHEKPSQSPEKTIARPPRPQDPPPPQDPKTTKKDPKKP